MANSRTRIQPMEFRQQEVGYVMERWRAADSCSLVGVGSVGKSNLLQHLSEPTVQSFYMKDVAGGKSFKSIIIDPSMLGPLPSTASDSEQIRCWAGYELMMHRLFLAFYPFETICESDDIQVFYEDYIRHYRMVPILCTLIWDYGILNWVRAFRETWYSDRFYV